MGEIMGESVSKRLLEFRRQGADKFVPTVPLAEAATPGLVSANQEALREALWHLEYDEVMDRGKRDLEFDLNNMEPGTITHAAFKEEVLIQKSYFWFPYLTPEQRRKFEKDEVKLTAGEKTEARENGKSEDVALEEKKKKRLERKASLLNRERRIDWERGIDKSIWERLNNRFFLESKGVTYADIDEELSKGFLETFDREEEMYNYLLGVGWNQKLVDIFDNRRKLVDELREISSQRTFKIKEDGTIVRLKGESDKQLKDNKERRAHFDDLKKDEDKMNAIKNLLWDKEGDSLGELRRKLEIEKADVDRTRYLFGKREKEEQVLLDRRSQTFFQKEFVKLEQHKEQLRVLTGIGNTAELMRVLRLTQKVELADDDVRSNPGHLKHYEYLQRHAYGLINEDVLSSRGKLNSFAGFTQEQQWQLNNRSQTLFGDDFLNLSHEEQLMATVGSGEILSLEEIMSFLGEYAVPNPHDNTATPIRPESVDLEYVYWKRLGWVSMIGPWRLADRINKIIFNYSARDDQRLLQRQQIESAGMSGFGKYTYFDYDYYEAFYGAGGEGKRKVLLERTIDQVEWGKGFWKEYQESQRSAYTKYVNEAKKIGGSKRIADFEEFCYGTIDVRNYQKIAQEWFLSGWRLVAEGVYLKLRGEMVERAAKWGGKAEQIKEALEQDIMQQKITHAGEKILEERFNKSRRGLFLDTVELFKCWTDKEGHRFTRFGNAFLDLFARQLGLNFFFKEMDILGLKTSPASLLNWLYVFPRFLTTWLATRPVTILAFQKWGLKFAGFHFVSGGWAAAWPYAVIFVTLLGGIPLLRDRLIFMKDVGEKKWANMEEKMNERFKALAENPTRARIESGWDPKKASIETHEPIKII